MNSRFPAPRCRRIALRLAIGLAALPAANAQDLRSFVYPDLAALAAGTDRCTQTSTLEAQACSIGVVADYVLVLAGCLNLADRDEARECAAEADAARVEDEAECGAQAAGRVEVCAMVGEAAYDPDYEPEDFADPREIGRSVEPHPYFPLVAGMRWVYRASFRDEDGRMVEEENVVTVTDRLKLVDGVLVRVVNDVVTRNGAVHEDTDDWLAQDRDGNVWYFGEIVRNYEFAQDDVPPGPALADIDGSWKAGETGVAGIIMLAEPEVGRAYRQEFSIDGPQDLGEVLSVTASESVPGATCSNDCVVTRDWTPVEPGIEAHKYYAPGIGLILEIEADGSRVELIEFSGP